MNGPKKATPLDRWFKSNLDKSYQVTSSIFETFDISCATISKMSTAIDGRREN